MKPPLHLFLIFLIKKCSFVWWVLRKAVPLQCFSGERLRNHIKSGCSTVGSILGLGPRGRTFESCHPDQQRALSSVGSERLPYKQRVGGSNPSAPTKRRRILSFSSFFIIYWQRCNSRIKHYCLPVNVLKQLNTYIGIMIPSFFLLARRIITVLLLLEGGTLQCYV